MYVHTQACFKKYFKNVRQIGKNLQFDKGFSQNHFVYTVHQVLKTDVCYPKEALDFDGGQKKRKHLFLWMEAL